MSNSQPLPAGVNLKTPDPKKDSESVFYELTRSICPICRRVIDARVYLRDKQGLYAQTLSGPRRVRSPDLQ